MKLKASGDRRSPIKTKGKGEDLALPTLGFTLPVTAQLLVDDGVSIECWSAEYAQASRNDAARFQAKGP